MITNDVHVQIRRFIKEKRLEFVGGGWVSPDEVRTLWFYPLHESRVEKDKWSCYSEIVLMVSLSLLLLSLSFYLFWLSVIDYSSFCVVSLRFLVEALTARSLHNRPDRPFWSILTASLKDTNLFELKSEKRLQFSSFDKLLLFFLGHSIDLLHFLLFSPSFP